MRYVRRGQQSSRRTGNSQLALISGTVNASGDYNAHRIRSEPESTDKPRPQTRASASVRAGELTLEGESDWSEGDTEAKQSIEFELVWWREVQTAEEGALDITTEGQ